jgi:hypothetical protein
MHYGKSKISETCNSMQVDTDGDSSDASNKYCYNVAYGSSELVNALHTNAYDML